MGCYPLFACRDWPQLQIDLGELGNDLVSLTLVTDPFGAYSPDSLKLCFDLVVPFKEHFVIDCARPLGTVVSKNHRYQARKALRQVHVEICPEPVRILDEWTTLYETLIRRHGLTGMHAFSQAVFSAQLRLPGIVALRAVHGDVTVGAILSFAQGDVGYAHLVAVSEAGYELGASYALFWCMIEHLSQTVRWLSIGATAGISGNPNDGLHFFKRGWTREKRMVYLCGKIFDWSKYAQLVQAQGNPTTDYFPAYRRGEFR
jgi:hypothetical protein